MRSCVFVGQMNSPIKSVTTSVGCTLRTLSYSDLILCFIMQSQEWMKHKKPFKGRRGKLILLLAEEWYLCSFDFCFAVWRQYQTKTGRDAWEWISSSWLSHIGFSQHLAGRVHPGRVLSPRGRSWISLEKKRFFLSTPLIFLSANSTR